MPLYLNFSTRTLQKHRSTKCRRKSKRLPLHAKEKYPAIPLKIELTSFKTGSRALCFIERIIFLRLSFIVL